MIATLSPLTAPHLPACHELLLALGQSDGVRNIRTSIADLRKHLLCDSPVAFGNLVFVDDALAGVTIHSWKWGAFTGARDMYIHALYIRPEYRRQGVARSTMKQLAKIALANECSRMEWLAVRENDSGRAFYDAIGAETADHMVVRRVGSEGLAKLAG